MAQQILLDHTGANLNEVSLDGVILCNTIYLRNDQQI
jgi:hypothetical protein